MSVFTKTETDLTFAFTQKCKNPTTARTYKLKEIHST